MVSVGQIYMCDKAAMIDENENDDEVINEKSNENKNGVVDNESLENNIWIDLHNFENNEANKIYGSDEKKNAVKKEKTMEVGFQVIWNS